MRNNVFAAYMLKELGLCEKTFRLFPRAAQHQSPATLLKAVRQFFEGVQPCCIECRHIAEPQNHYRIEGIEIGDCLFKFVSGSEYEGGVNSDNGDIQRHLLRLKYVESTLFYVCRENR